MKLLEKSSSEKIHDNLIAQAEILETEKNSVARQKILQTIVENLELTYRATGDTEFLIRYYQFIITKPCTIYFKGKEALYPLALALSDYFPTADAPTSLEEEKISVPPSLEKFIPKKYCVDQKIITSIEQGQFAEAQMMLGKIVKRSESSLLILGYVNIFLKTLLAMQTEQFAFKFSLILIFFDSSTKENNILDQIKKLSKKTSFFLVKKDTSYQLYHSHNEPCELLSPAQELIKVFPRINHYKELNESFIKEIDVVLYKKLIQLNYDECYKKSVTKLYYYFISCQDDNFNIEKYIKYKHEGYHQLHNKKIITDLELTNFFNASSNKNQNSSSSSSRKRKETSSPAEKEHQAKKHIPPHVLRDYSSLKVELENTAKEYRALDTHSKLYQAQLKGFQNYLSQIIEICKNHLKEYIGYYYLLASSEQFFPKQEHMALTYIEVVIKHFQNIITRSTQEKEVLACALNLRGELKCQIKLDEYAKEDFENAFKENPTLAWPAYNLAMHFKKIGLFKTAQTHLEFALKNGKTDSAVGKYDLKKWEEENKMIKLIGGKNGNF